MRHVHLAFIGLLAVIALLAAIGVGRSAFEPGDSAQAVGPGTIDLIKLDADPTTGGTQVCVEADEGTAFSFDFVVDEFNAADSLNVQIGGNVGVNFVSGDFTYTVIAINYVPGVLDDDPLNAFAQAGQLSTTTKVPGKDHLGRAYYTTPPANSGPVGEVVVAQVTLTPTSQAATTQYVTIDPTQPGTPLDGAYDSFFGSSPQILPAAGQGITVAVSPSASPGTVDCPPADLNVTKALGSGAPTSMDINTPTTVPVDATVTNAGNIDIFTGESVITQASLGRVVGGSVVGGTAGECTISNLGPATEPFGPLAKLGGSTVINESFQIECTYPSTHRFSVTNVVDNLDGLTEDTPTDNTYTLEFDVDVLADGDADLTSFTLFNMGDFTAPGTDKVDATLMGGLNTLSQAVGGPASLVATTTGVTTVLDLRELVDNTASDVPMDIQAEFTVSYAGAVMLDPEYPATGHPAPASYDAASGDCFTNPVTQTSGPSSTSDTVTVAGVASGTTGVAFDTTAISIKCIMNSFENELPDNDIVTVTDNSVAVYLFTITNTVSPVDPHIEDPDAPSPPGDTLQISNGDFAAIPGQEFWVLSIDPFDPSYSAKIDSLNTTPVSDVCILGQPCNIATNTQISEFIPGLPDPLTLRPDEDSVPLAGILDISPVEMDVAPGVALAGAFFPANSVWATTGHPGVISGNRVGDQTSTIRTNLSGNIADCTDNTSLSLQDPLLFWASGGATITAGIVDAALPANQAHIPSPAGDPLRVALQEGPTIPAADYTGSTGAIYTNDLSTISGSYPALPGMVDTSAPGWPLDASPGTPPDPLTGMTITAGTEVNSVGANLPGDAVVVTAPWGTVPAANTAYTIDTAGALANPLVWSERIESDAVLAGVMATGAPIWAHYLGLALIDVPPAGGPLPGGNDILVPVNIVVLSLGAQGYAARVVVGDPSSPDPASRMCTPLDTTLTMLGKAENIPPPFGPGGSAELIRTCNTELPSASPPYVMAFANKLTREDSGGQVTLTDTDGACTAKTDAAVTSVDIPDRPAPGNPVAAGIADSDTATVEALNNDNPAATSMNVLLELTHETAVCPEINWDDTSVVVNGSPGVGTVIDTAIVGGQRTQTMLVIAGSLTQLLPVQVLADYDYNCTADGTTDLVLDVVISHTVGGDDPADQFDNLGVDTASADSDLDLDDDTVNNAADNCLNVANTDQANADGDAEGNACDNDADGDGVPNASDDCDVALNATSLPPATGATSITEDYGDKETSDGCADTDATSSQTAIALGPGIGQPGEIPVNDTVQREVTVRFANGDHNANLSNLIQVNSNVNNCVVEMASPTPDIEFTDAGTGAHMEVRDYGSAYFTADDSTPGSGTDEQNVTVTLDITCVAVGSATATIFTHTLPVSPIEEEDLAAPNDTSQVISLTAGADTDGDTIPDSVDDCDPVPEDADAIDDNDGCPDVDAQVINATAGSAMTVYKGYPQSRTVSVEVRNETLNLGSSAAVDDIAVDYTITGDPTYATVTWVGTGTTSEAGGSGPLATQTGVTLSDKSLNIVCDSDGTGESVNVSIARSGMSPAGTIDEANTTGDEADTTSLSVTCLVNDPALSVMTIPAPGTISGDYVPPIAPPQVPPLVDSSGGTLTINQDAQNTLSAPAGQDVTDMLVEWTITANPSEVDAKWSSNSLAVRQFTVASIAAGASQGITDTLDVTCAAQGNFTVDIDTEIVSLGGGSVVQLANDQNLANNDRSGSVSVACDIDTDGDGTADGSDATPDHDLVSSNEVVTGPAPVVKGAGPTLMWVQFDMDNLGAGAGLQSGDHTEITQVAVSATGLPPECSISGTAIPFLPASALLGMLDDQSRTVTWKTEITCTTSATPDTIYDVTVTASVDHLLQAGDGDETTAAQTNNAQATLKGVLVKN